MNDYCWRILALTAIISLSRCSAETLKRSLVWQAESRSLTNGTSFGDCLLRHFHHVNDSFEPPRLVLPGDLAYPLATLTFNLAIQNNASAILYPSSCSDVSEAIKCAATFGVPVVGRSGGHSYASFGSGPGSLVIDVTQLRQFSFLASCSGEEGELVKIGAGLRLGDLELALNSRSRAASHGVCPYIGVAGHALCGGFGVTSRMWGLFTDQITSMEVVIANGTILNISEDVHRDLFFAMRGAGPSFGILTSMTIRTHPAPESVIQFYTNYRFPNAEAAAGALEQFQAWSLESAPPEIGIRFAISHTQPKNSSLPDINWQLRGNFYGTLERFERVIRTLSDRFDYAAEDAQVKQLSWLESVKALAKTNLSSAGINPSNNNASFYAKSIMVPDSEPSSQSRWLNFTTALYNRPANLDSSASYWFIEIELVGGRYKGKPTSVKALASATSSFAARDALLLFQIGGYGKKGTMLATGHGMDVLRKFITTLYVSLGGGKKERSGFACYVDPEFSADRAHREYFGSHITGLLKESRLQWDPNQVFRYPQGF